MEKYKAIIKLGIKYLIRYKRRYFFLLAALIFGFTVISFITSTKDGMYNNAYQAAQSHYAGDIVAVAHDFSAGSGFLHRMGMSEINTVINAAKNADLNIREIVFRTFGLGTPSLHHAGDTVNLRYLMGCDEYKDYEIVLSAPVAENLKVSVNDYLTLELDTRYGQKNTGEFIVKEIVQDTSIFGYYKAYISRVTLNRLLLYDDDDVSQIGFYLNNPKDAEKQRMEFYNSLSTAIQTGDIVHDREGMVRERDKAWEGSVIFLYTMPVYLSEISDILNAMNILTYILFAMMLITIIVSAGVTYNLILNERAKEMGVMRTIGFFGLDMRIVLWTEIIIVTVISMISGFIFSCLLSFAASFISFAWFPGFEIFLKNDRLVPMYLWQTILSNSVMLVVVIILLVVYQSNKVINKKLPALLSGEPL